MTRVKLSIHRVTLLQLLLGASVILAGTQLMGDSTIAQPYTVGTGGVIAIPVSEETDAVEFLGEHQLMTNGYAILGVPLGTKQGLHIATVHSADGSSEQLPIHVSRSSYPEEHLTITQTSKVNPPSTDMPRITAETKLVRAKYALFSDHPAQMPFVDNPVDGRVSSVFGLRRFLNDQPRSPHSGLDIAAPTGTPIRMPIAGKVVLTHDLFFNGNTLMVDHGGGFISMMCHMDEISVAEGDLLEVGDVVGTVGATGRVTGPHIHWSVSLAGSRVDPQKFIATMNALVDSGSTAVDASVGEESVDSYGL